MSEQIRVLVVEDSQQDAELVLRELRRVGYEPIWKRVETEADYLAQLDHGWEIILTDYTLPQFSGSRAVELLNDRGLDIPIVIVSGTIGEETAVEAMKAGAHDYVMKGRLARLGPAVQRELRAADERQKRRRASEELIASEMRYRRLFESAKDGILILDAETGAVVDVNPFLIELLGFSRETFLGMKLWDLGFFKDIIADQDSFAELQREQYVRYEDKPLETRDGRRIDVEFVSNVYLVNNRKVIQCNVRDITERKRAEAALRESEDQHRTILRTAMSGFWLADERGRLLETNESYCRMSGYSEQELRTMRVSDLEAAETDDDTAAHIQKIMAQGHDRFESRQRRNDGTVFDVEVSVQYLPLEEGGRLVAFLGDITERKRAEEALREANQRLDAHMANSPIAVVEFDPTFRVVRWSDQAEQVFGWRRDEILGKAIAEMRWVVEEDAESVQRVSEDMLTGRRPRNLNVNRNYRKDGAIIQCEWYNSAIYNEQGRVISTLSLVLDITERSRAEEALKRSEARFKEMFDDAPVGYHELDAEGRVTHVNRTELEMLGYDIEDMLGRHVWEFVDDREDSRQRVIDKLVGALPPPPFRERTYRRKDGTQLAVLVEERLIRGNDGAVTGIRTTVQNITERKRADEEKAKLEAQLRQAQKMESVGRLAGGVAHDFNNMMGVILGYADFALKQVDAAQPLHADLQEIHKAATRAADLTRQLLAFARKQTIAPKVLDLNDTVPAMLKILRRLIGEDIDLNWQCGADLWLIKMDPAQIDQILANLCVNARDAISGVGKMTIETRNSTIDKGYCATHEGSAPGQYVRLAVSDDGCGMDKETLSHLFEPFFTTKAVGEGTGLGLATVYGVVKQNGGFINVYSEPNHGTTFTIYLPRHHVGEAEQARAEGEARPVPRGHETILLVEDEPAILRLTKTMLEQLGYTVMSAGTPGGAISLAKEHTGEIELLITDVIMPEMNGRTLAENLLSVYPLVKHLFMSGYTTDLISRQGVLDEGVHFIQKPFSSDDLAAKVREVLDAPT